MVQEPFAIGVTNPELLTIATDELEVVQTMVSEESLGVIDAVSCWVSLAEEKETVEGLTEIAVAGTSMEAKRAS